MRAALAAVGAAAGHRNVLSRPAVGAKPFPRNADRRHEVIDRLERERRQIELLADKLDHSLVLCAFVIGVFRNVRALAFVPAYVAAGDEVVFVLRARKIDEPARVQKRRTGDTHVHFAAAVPVEPLRLLAELGAAHDRVVAEHQLALADQTGYGNQFHRRDLFALTLVRRRSRCFAVQQESQTVSKRSS